MGPGPTERGEPAQIRAENVHLAEDAGLFVGDPGGVEVGGVSGRKEVPALPAHRRREKVEVHAGIWVKFSRGKQEVSQC